MRFNKTLRYGSQLRLWLLLVVYLFSAILHVALAHDPKPSDALRQWQSSGERVDSSKGRIFVTVLGEGNKHRGTIVFIHGFPTSSWDYHKVIPAISARYKTIAIDMLGFGYSDKPISANYSTLMQSQLIKEVLDKLNASEFHIMASSFGSSVALDLLRGSQTGSHNILSVTFLNGGLFPETNHPRLAQRLLLSPVGKWINMLLGKGTLDSNLTAIFSKEHPPSKQLLDDYWHLLSANKGNEILYKLIGYLRDRREHASSWNEALRSFPGKVFTIFGTQDELSGPEVVKQLRSVRQIHKELLLPDAGHYPQLERPDIVVKEYLSFLEEM